MIGRFAERLGKRIYLPASLVCFLVLLNTTVVLGDEQIPLIGGRVTDSEWQIIQNIYGDNEMLRDPLWVEPYSHDRPVQSIEEALAFMRQNLTYVGYYDVDRDGGNEMLVYFEYWCGNVGCNTDILKKGESGWTTWQSVIVFEPQVLCATDDPPLGLPTLYSLFTAAWWDGSDYARLCLRKLYCDKQHKSDFERNLAKSLEERPLCWDVISGLPGGADVAMVSS